MDYVQKDAQNGAINNTQGAIILICTRLNSSRLPGKALMQIEGLSALDHILLRIKDSGIPIYLAVPYGEAGRFKPILAHYPNIGLFEGNSESPLHRMSDFIEALQQKPRYIIRITHDDLLIDSRTMLQLLECMDEGDAGYGFTPGIAEGAGVEIIRTENLIKAAKDRKEPTEFVSYFVQGDGMPFPKVFKMQPRQSIKRPYRLTLDYPEDALVLKIVLRELGAMAKLDTICQHLDQKPYLLGINRLPDVTFYTCVKDMQQWIGDTMLSVLGTNVPDMEYIVVDDGSTDGTLSEVCKFSNDPRLKLIVNDRNIGLASSSNVALKEAKGKIIIRVDADDMLIAGSFKQSWPRIQWLLYNDLDILYPAYSEIDEYGKITSDCELPSKNHHAGCAIMNRAWLNEWHFRDGLKHWDSLELFKRIDGKARIGHTDIPLWQYRRRASSMSTPSQDRDLAKAELG